MELRSQQQIANRIRRAPEYRGFKHCADAVAEEFAAQTVCEICGAMLEVGTARGERRVRDAIDHCHATGQYRGRLCQPCNTFEGVARKAEPDFWRLAERIARQRGADLQRVVAYLARTEEGVPMDTRQD